MVHTFGKIWDERGFINAKGKTLVHQKLVKETLEALKDPLEIAVVHIKGHQKGNSIEAQGNNLADRGAKEAALEKEGRILHLVDMGDEDNEEIPIFSERERKELQKHGGTRDEKGKWTMLDGRQVLNKALARKILESLHASTHWGTQALCDHFQWTYVCTGVFEIAKIITRDCIICQRINKKVMRKALLGGRQLAQRPFQSVQVDFTELPPQSKNLSIY